jgi:hypothetical protein
MGKVAKRNNGSNKPTSRTRRRHDPFSAPFAVRSDGRVMINVADCTGYSVEGREIFKGALLTPSESRSVLKNAGDGLAWAASCILRKLPYRRRAEASQPKARRPQPKKSGAKAKPAE